MQEDPATLITPVSSSLHPEEVARRTFSTVRKGLDPREVHEFLQRVSRDLERQREREVELRRRLADAEHRAAHPQLDEAALTTALGDETARVLRSAYDAANGVRSKAEESSARVVADATEQANRMRQDAEEAAAEAGRAAVAEAERVLESARAEAEGVLEAARRQGRAMLEEAHQLRTRVLGDLSRRRRVLHDQVERLRTGRENLLEATRVARTSLERIEQELQGAEEEARPLVEGQGGEPEAATLERPETPPEPPEAREQTDAREPPEKPTEPTETGPESAPVRADSGGAGTASPPSGGAVGQLFARIKAAQTATREPTPVAGKGDAPGADGAGTTVVPEPEAPPPTASVESKGKAAEEAAGPDQALFEQRDAAIGPLAQSLARRLKRTLQDEQNALLDQLRRQAGRGQAHVLPAAEEQQERFRRAALEVLVEAERVGTEAATGWNRAFGPGGAEAEPAAASPARAGTGDGPVNVAARAGEAGPREAEALAEEVVSALRRRLEERVGGQGERDHPGAVEAVGATYREWRGPRIERAAMDHVVSAFSSGVLAATPAGVSLRWVSRDEDGECADCDDNALAGALPPGEPFPTGQAHPPAHSGCRCLLAPTAS